VICAPAYRRAPIQAYPGRQDTCTMQVAAISQFARLRIGCHLDYSSFMDHDLCRRLMPRPEFGRSRLTTIAAAPATFGLVHLQVVGCEQIPIAADAGYCHGLADPFQGEAHHIRFGCSKARPPLPFATVSIPTT